MTARTSIFLGFSATIATLALTSAARADAKGEACVKAFESSQEHRGKGRMAEALRELEVCSRSNCPDVLRIPCTTWKTEIENARPVLSFSFTDERGEPTTDGEVSIDGQTPVPASTQVTVAPGLHVLSATLPGRSAQEVRVNVSSGEHHRVSIAFSSPLVVAKDPPKVVRVRSGPPAITYVLGGVSAVGLASFIGFGLGGRTEQKRLEDTCSPRCTDKEVKTAKQRYLIADVSLGVSLVSAGLATYFALRQGPEPKTAKTWDVRVDAGPGAAGIDLTRAF